MPRLEWLDGVSPHLDLDADELIHLINVGRDRFEWILGCFVFEDDESLVIGFFENVDQATEIALGFSFLASWLDFDFELDIDRIRGAFFDITVGIVCMEVSRIEVNSNPRVRNRSDDFQERVGLRDDATVIFNA